MSDEEECGSVFPCLARMWGEKWWCVFFPITPCAETTRTSRLPHRRAPTYSHALSVSPLDAPSWFLSLWQQLNERAKSHVYLPFPFFLIWEIGGLAQPLKPVVGSHVGSRVKAFFFFSLSLRALSGSLWSKVVVCCLIASAERQQNRRHYIMWKNNKKDVPADLDSVTRRLSWESLTAGGGSWKVVVS